MSLDSIVVLNKVFTEVKLEKRKNESKGKDRLRTL